jgi:hypothetical protein
MDRQTQRLAMYIVISNPNRMSVATGRSHFITSILLLLSITPHRAVPACGGRLRRRESLASLQFAETARLRHGRYHESSLMIFMSSHAALRNEPASPAVMIATR